MDTFTTYQAAPAGGHRHHSAQGFCTVCGTAWPCWRGLGEGTTLASLGGSGPALVTTGVRSW